MNKKHEKENIQVIHLSKNNLVVTFNKNAIAAIREGGASAIKIKTLKGELTFLFMRDTAYKERMKEFNQSEMVRGDTGFGWRTRMKNFFFGWRRPKITPVGNHRKVEANGSKD